MSRKKRGSKDALKSRDKILTKMSKDGAIEQNVTIGNEIRISSRDMDFDIRTGMSIDGIIDEAISFSDSAANQAVKSADTPIKPDSHTTHGSSSRIGIKFDGEGAGNKKGKSGKQKTLRTRRKQALKDNANAPPTKTSLIDGSENNIQAPHKSLFQSEAAIYDFPETPKNDDIGENARKGRNSSKLNPTLAAEHDPKGKVSHKSQSSKSLNQHRLSNIRQSPKSSKFVIVPPIDTIIGDVDGNAEALRTMKKSRKHHQRADSNMHQNSDDSVNPSTLNFTEDETEFLDVPCDNNDQDMSIQDVNRGHGTTGTNEEPSASAQDRQNRRLNNAETAGDSENPDSSQSNDHRDRDRCSDEQPPQSEPDTPKPSRKISRLEHGVDKTAGKLDKAKNNLPTKRKLRMERTFDEELDKGKTRLTFDKEVISQKEHLKGALPLRPVKFAANTAIAKAHMKVFQVEDENVGVKAAHKVELAGEATVRSALRHRKLAPYKKVAKLERKLSKRSAKLSYQRALHENPKLKRNPIARMWQKRRIKRQHAKALRESHKAAARAKKAGSLAAKATRAATMLIKKNPKVIIAVVVLFLVVNIISSLFGMLSSVGSSGAGAIFATTYLSEEAEIEAVSLAYNRWEMDLIMEIQNVVQNHPGFDEYRFNTGEISHCPFELIAYLTATHFIFTLNDVEAELRALFDEQYQLSFTPSIETRFRYEEDAEGYLFRVYYDWHVMTVTLTARNFTDAITNRMTAEQRLHFDLLMQTRGQRQIVGNPFGFGWQSFITSEYGYRIHPITGVRDLHRGIDIGVPTGTPILAGFDGTVTFAGMSGGYGNVVIIQGENGLEARYAHMDTIGVSIGQTVDMGDEIGTVGSTGSSTGPHLHLEILRNGQFLNPIFFTDMGSFDSSSPPSTLPNNNPPRLPMGEGTFEDLLNIADTILGAPYVWGGSGPNVFDCSGLVVWLLNQAGIADVPRTTAQGLFNLSSPVSLNEAQPGDLIFFQGTFSSPRTVTHVGIYVGNGMMLHTGSNPAGVEFVSINTPFWQRHFFAFGRIN